MAKLFAILFFILITSLSGCLRNKNKLSILFDRVDNLEIGNDVRMKGLQIGKVSSMELFKDGVLVGITLQNDVKVPSGSKFFIESSFLGSSYIMIESSSQSSFLALKDTAAGSFVKEKKFDEWSSDSTKQEKIKKATKKIGEGINDLINATKDSTKSK